jgi:hypothetical protein
MSKININIGTNPNDGTGDPLRTAYQSLNTMMTEIYLQKNREYDLNAKVINEFDDMYAHESQILIKRVDNTVFLFLMYCQDKTTELEWNLTAKAVLKVYELTTLTHLRTFETFYPGLTAGITMPAGEEICCPRGYFVGTTIRMFCCNTGTLYQREIDISNDNYAAWTISDLSITQMTMKNAIGIDVLRDVISANIQVHLEFVLGDAYAGYANLMPMFRNLVPAVSGANWYANLQFSGERSHLLPAPCICVTSTDSGNTWKFGSIVGYTTSNRIEVIEPSIIFLGTNLHIINRTSTTSIAHYLSIDNGVTWVAQTDIPLNTRAAKPCAINYLDPIGTQKNVMAIQLSSEITNDASRTTLGIYTTTDFITFTEIAKIIIASDAHYPSLRYFAKSLYLSYTKGMKDDTNPYNDRDTIAITRIF